MNRSPRKVVIPQYNSAITPRANNATTTTAAVSNSSQVAAPLLSPKSFHKDLTSTDSTPADSAPADESTSTGGTAKEKAPSSLLHFGPPSPSADVNVKLGEKERKEKALLAAAAAQKLVLSASSYQIFL